MILASISCSALNFIPIPTFVKVLATFRKLVSPRSDSTQSF